MEQRGGNCFRRPFWFLFYPENDYGFRGSGGRIFLLDLFRYFEKEEGLTNLSTAVSGLLNLRGDTQASYRAFQLLNKLGDERYVRAGAQGTVDVYGVRKNACQAVQFLAVNHHSLLHEIREEEIEIRLTGAAPVKAAVERLDEAHGNALACWQGMGEPDYPDRAQLALLEAASYTKEETMEIKDGTITLTLPPMGAALITMYL